MSKSKLYFYYGTMSSAKTLNLLTTAHNFDENNIEALCLKPSTDTRDGVGVIRSRAGLERECIMIDSSNNIYDSIAEYITTTKARLQWILIDEAQFLQPEQVDQLSDIVDHLGINVMCYGLRTDFQSKMFPGSKRLFELADTITEVKHICRCGEHKAIINARINDACEVVTDGDQVMIGGDDKYIPMCRRCWKNHI